MATEKNPLQRIITTCWKDEAFKTRLVADSAATLRTEGVDIPEGVTVNVAVDTEDVRTLVIPAPPGKLNDEALDGLLVSAGDCPTDGAGFTCQQVHVPN